MILDSSEEEDEPPTGMLSIPQSPPQSLQSSSSSSISCSKLDEEPGNEEMGHSSSTSQSRDIESLTDDLLGGKVTDLVHALILKYQLKEPVTEVEMLQVVTKEYKNWLPMIFEKASSCLEMLCGIDVRKMDSINHTYVLVNSLHLTYDTVLSDGQNMPTNGFLIMILGVIVIEGNYATEEDIWEFLDMIGVYEGKEHFLYGEPRKLLQDLVQENYLEYFQVPSSNHPRYVFLWGPRAKAETTKMKVLQFVAKIKGTDPSFFLDSYKEALKEEEERAQATVGSAGSTSASFFAASPDPED
ncbi:melanoma-associated antigen 10-like [Heterocephalus glaber]|uniref:Melanoma-associated antigen 10-like n=2 Tax=Heterocephalus glaber TaxID=10181 RepID=A0AAX6PX59_HETGA|nr:melanoma-associated antigen 10-like [Heterocephalus glaber]